MFTLRYAGNRWVVMGLSLIGRMCISAAYQVLYLYSAELLPTEVRLQGLGSATVASRLGSMISPFVTELLVGRSMRRDETGASLVIIRFVCSFTSI